MHERPSPSGLKERVREKEGTDLERRGSIIHEDSRALGRLRRGPNVILRRMNSAVRKKHSSHSLPLSKVQSSDVIYSCTRSSQFLSPQVASGSSATFTGITTTDQLNGACIKHEPSENDHRVSESQIGAIVLSRPTNAQAALNARARRAKINDGIEVLQNSMHSMDKGNRDSVLDDVIDHIKFLKLQMKVLSGTKLSGEPTPSPLVHLEGYGHYLINSAMCDEPLEEVVGQLLEDDVDSAVEMLERKGLLLLPINLAESLLHSD